MNLFILFEGVFCNRCGQKHRVQSQRDSKERKFEYMRDAITNQVWKSLTPYELSILAFVAKNEGRQKILNRAVFSFPKNRQAEQWDILNGFNRRHLMYIEQDEKNKSILHIHVHGDLYQTLKTDYPNLFTFENRDPQVLQPLTFVANENKLEETDNQPDYSGFIDSFPAEVVICPEKSYNYGVWKRKDGSLFIKLEPLSESLTQYYKKK